jgi:pimeloyl-ACP methyl ester carboxylesterase
MRKPELFQAAIAFRRVVAFAFAAGAAACSSGDSNPSPPPADAPEPVAFTACPSATFPKLECATLDVPLDWSARDGETIPFFVRRIPASVEPARAQLWMQPGGPGASGDAMLGTAKALAERDPTLEIFVPDHRGAGSSNWIGCEGEDELAPACVSRIEAQWGGRMQHFGPTAAAKDWGHAIERTRVAGRPVYVYGVSYGSYFVNRYLSLFPTQPDAAIFDSVVPADESAPRTFTRADAYANENAKRIFALCAEDTFCAGKMGTDGTDPWQRLVDVSRKLDSGHCPDAALTRTSLKRLLAALASDGATRALLPAVVYRLDRCDATDAFLLRELEASILGSAGARPGNRSGGTFMATAILFSELWDATFSAADGRAQFDAAEVALRGPESFAESFATYPKSLLYARDEHWGKLAQTTVPILLLNGGLDPTTPTSELGPTRAHFANASFVEVKSAGHAVLRTDACGLEVVAAFVADPKRAPDVACARAPAAVDFRGDRRFLDAVGLEDAWENGR